MDPWTTGAGGTSLQAERSDQVAIIMSVFNGQNYLADQLESILAQRGVSWSLWIRDDGSTDSTHEIVRRYNDPRIHYQFGPNLGARRSFFEAISSCPADCDFYGFADHDDVWMPDKLSRSVEAMSRLDQSRPAMTCSRLALVDSDLRLFGATKVPRELSLRNALVETVTPGASILLNRAAFALLRSRTPIHAVMHDAWVYLLLSAFGDIEFMSSPTLFYRQHSANVAGTGRSLSRRWLVRWQRLRVASEYWTQANEFMRLYEAKLSGRQLETVRRYVSYRLNWRTRIAFTVRPSVSYQSLRANIFLRVLLLLGRG